MSELQHLFSGESRLSAIVSKRFSDELSALIGKRIRVILSSGACFEGTVAALNPGDYSIWLSDVREKDGGIYDKVFISGRSIECLFVLEAGPDLSKLAERLNKVFPNMVRYIKEADVILVMDRIRVTKDGVVEGTGPAAERVKKIYEEWLSEEAKV
ncbi:MAG: Lsm family RNA-binding protein [Nitrososphaerota archaeon]